MRVPQPAVSCRKVIFLLALAVRALGAQVDTLPSGPFLIWRDAAILEGFVIATVAAAPLDKSFAQRLQNPSVQENQTMRTAADFVRLVADPGSVIIGVGMYTYGRLAKKRRAADLGLHGTEALLIGAEVGNLLKGVVGRARPYLDVDRPHDYKVRRRRQHAGSPQLAFALLKSGIIILSELRGPLRERILDIQRRFDPKLARNVPPHVTITGSSGIGPIATRTTAAELRRALEPIAQ